MGATSTLYVKIALQFVEFPIPNVGFWQLNSAENQTFNGIPLTVAISDSGTISFSEQGLINYETNFEQAIAVYGTSVFTSTPDTPITNPVELSGVDGGYNQPPPVDDEGIEGIVVDSFFATDNPSADAARASNVSIPQVTATWYSGGYTENFTINSYYWTKLSVSTLFTTGNDVVNFDSLTPSQQSLIASGALIYYGLGGSDTVTLPNEANYNKSVGGGKNLGWTDTPASTFYTGSQIGDTYTVNGGDGNYFIVEGGGTEDITISGAGSSNVTGGTGTDNIIMTGDGSLTFTGTTGNYNISEGAGTNTISMNGAGDSEITVYGGTNPQVSIGGGGTLDVYGNVTGESLFQVLGSTLDIHKGFPTAGTVDFTVAPSGVVILNDPSDFNGTIINAVNGDTVVAVMNSGGNFTIDLQFDSYAISAGTAFMQDVENAAQQLVTQLHVSHPITVNIDIEYNEGGVPAGGGQGTPYGFALIDYQTVRSALIANGFAGDPALNGLPATTPFPGYPSVTVYPAQEKALGFLPGDASTLDGVADFGTDLSQSDVIATALHELTHALGRVTGALLNTGPDLTVFDLFRFTSVGNRLIENTTPATPSYFSLDGGNTKIADYGTLSDPGDFLNDYSQQVDNQVEAASPLTPEDPFDQVGDDSSKTFLTQADLAQMDVLGFSTNLACFVAGTGINTPRGDVTVESLKTGEFVHARFAGCAPVKWIGVRTIGCRHHPDPIQVWPVHVSAGAFGENAPRHDLFLSPDHAVCVNDVLIPIKYLINGCTINQEPRDEVTYYHIELEQHDVLFAEGLPVESYLDTGDRSHFSNGGKPTSLHPDFSVRMREAMGCAPLVVTGAALTSVRSHLLQCAPKPAVEADRKISAINSSNAA